MSNPAPVTAVRAAIVLNAPGDWKEWLEIVMTKAWWAKYGNT